MPRRQIRDRDNTNASGKAHTDFIDTNLHQSGLLRPHPCCTTVFSLGNGKDYEEVLVVRVHADLLQQQRIPPSLVTKHIWRDRYEDINAVERYLTRNGIAIRKFFLHVSPEEQKRRLLERLEDPSKQWKVSITDAKERDYWYDYMNAYEQMVRYTSREYAPWFVVPADHKWFTRLVVAGAVIDALEGMDLTFPTLDAVQRKELQAVREFLEVPSKSPKDRGQPPVKLRADGVT